MQQEQESPTQKEISQLFKLYTKRYSESEYNCAHFVRDSYKVLFDVDLTDSLSGFMLPVKDRKPDLARIKDRLVLIKTPKTPCIAVTSDPHVGIYLNGKILHSTVNGVFYDEPETVGENIRYYECR